MSKFQLSSTIVAFVLISDQVTKYLIRSSLSLYERVSVLPFMDFVHYQNKGAAFGMLNTLPEYIRIPLFALVLIVAVVVLVSFLRKTPDNDILLISALSLILAGAISNSIDRFWKGQVTDFIDLHWFGNPDLHWAAFNVSDTAITVGVVIVVFDSLKTMKGK